VHVAKTLPVLPRMAVLPATLGIGQRRPRASIRSISGRRGRPLVGARRCRY